MTSNRRPVKRHRSNHPSNPSTTLVKSFDHLPKAVLGHVCSFLNSHDHKMVAANISQRFKKAAKCRHAWNGKVVFRWAKLLSKEEEKNGISSVRICEHINRLIETWNEWGFVPKAMIHLKPHKHLHSAPYHLLWLLDTGFHHALTKFILHCSLRDHEQVEELSVMLAGLSKHFTNLRILKLINHSHNRLPVDLDPFLFGQVQDLKLENMAYQVDLAGFPKLRYLTCKHVHDSRIIHNEPEQDRLQHFTYNTCTHDGGFGNFSVPQLRTLRLEYNKIFDDSDYDQWRNQHLEHVLTMGNMVFAHADTLEELSYDYMAQYTEEKPTKCSMHFLDELSYRLEIANLSPAEQAEELKKTGDDPKTFVIAHLPKLHTLRLYGLHLANLTCVTLELRPRLPALEEVEFVYCRMNGIAMFELFGDQLTIDGVIVRFRNN